MAQVDNFGGTTTQELGEVREEGAVFSVTLKRVRYADGHLQWNTCKIRTLRAGVVERLVEHLAPYREEVDVSYRTCFLCTYRTFTSAATVLRLLRERYLAVSPHPTERAAADKRVVQSLITSFLRVWLESYPSDFYSPPAHPLLSDLEQWAGQQEDLQRTLQTLRSSFSHRAMYQCGEIAMDGDGGLHNFSLFSLSAEDFARHLTAEDAHIFGEVVPHELLAYVRCPRQSQAPTVRACIEHFNRVSLVVIATILGCVTLEERGRAISQWIGVAEQCRLVKNFSSLKAIVCGLQSSAVFRLTRSWEAVPLEKAVLLEDLSALFSADDNHHMSRDLLTREGTGKYAEVSVRRNKTTKNGMGGSVQGVVPYLGTFLTDLTMIHTAHSDRSQEGLINFDKHRKEFEILAQLTLYQKAAANYSFPHNPTLIHWLRDIHTLSEHQSYVVSKQLEPDNSSALGGHSPPQPSLLKKTLRQLFLSKGTLVGDSSPRSSLSEKDPLAPAETQAKSSSSSSLGGDSSPPLLTKQAAPGGHVVRVAICNDSCCMYKSMLLRESDRAAAVVSHALEKHGLPGSPSQYNLLQLLEGNRTLLIPENANVYYALSHTPHQATLLLELKNSR